MKKTYLSLLIVTILSFNVLAQSADEKAVASQVDKLNKAMVDADEAQLKAIATSDLTYGHSSGTIEDKDAFVDALVSGKTDFSRIDISDQTISIVDDIALVRHTFNCDVNGNTITLGVLLVWKKEGKKWKLLARQAFRK